MTLTRPRLLFISPVMPDATGNGLAMRQAQFLVAYAQAFDVDLAVIPLAGAAEASPEFVARYTTRWRVFDLAEPDTYFKLLVRLKSVEDRLTAFDRYGRPSITARLTPEVNRALDDWIVQQNYQLVHTGRLYLLALGKPVSAPWVVDADENDAALYRQHETTARRLGHRFEAGWFAAEARHAAALTAAQLPKADYVFAASRDDAASLAPSCRAIHVVPNVVALPRYARPLRQRRLLFVGTLGYGPNREGLTWFIKYCWPILRKINPGIGLDVVGGSADIGLRRLMRRPGIDWHGWQPNLSRSYAQSSIAIIPIRVGGGSRIKTLEAAAHGRTIVATQKGSSGTCLHARRDFMLAETPAQFYRAISRALGCSQRLAMAARQAVARHHNPLYWQQQILHVARAIAFDKTL